MTETARSVEIWARSRLGLVGAFYLLSLAAGYVVALAAPPDDSIPGPHTRSWETLDSLRTALDSLRVQGRYDEAAATSALFVDRLGSRADVPAWEHQFAESLAATLGRIAALPEALRSELCAGDRAAARAMASNRRGGSRDGLDAGRAAAEIRARYLGANHIDVTAALDAVAEAHHHLREPARAESLYRSVLARNERYWRRPMPSTAMLPSDIAYQRMSQGDVDRARAGFAQSLRAFEDLGLRGGEGFQQVLMNHGTLESRVGSWDAARSFVERAVRCARAAHRNLPSALGELAYACFYQGANEDAVAAAREALADATRSYPPDSPEVVRARYDLGNFLWITGERAEAEIYLRDAVAVARKQESANPEGVVVPLITLAGCLRDQGRFVESESLYVESLRLGRTLFGPDASRMTGAINWYGFVLFATGRYEKAAEHFQRALDLRRRYEGPIHASVLESLVSLAMAENAMGRPARAESLLSVAATVYEEVRLLSGAPATRATGYAISPYSRLAALELRRGARTEAWNHLERHHARALQDLVASGADSLGAAALPLDRVQRSLGERTALVGWLEEELGITRPPNWAGGDPMIPDRLSGKLAEQGRLWGYVIRGHGPVEWIELTPSARTCTARVARSERLRSALSSALGSEEHVVRDLAREMWNERVLPLLPLLKGVESLVVVPSDGLADVPLEVLGEHPGELGERFSLSYAPSGSVYALLQERERRVSSSRDGLALLVGNPDYTRVPAPEDRGRPLAPRTSAAGNSGSSALGLVRGITRGVLYGDREALDHLQPLAGSEGEIREIAGIVPRSRSLTGAAASERALGTWAREDSLKQYSILHFATHALVDRTNAGRSALILSLNDSGAGSDSSDTASDFDGVLHAFEIEQGWRLNAELVVLSACQTGLGRRVRGEGTMGFGYPLFAAGAQCLLVGLWAIDDQATSLLMRRFYQNAQSMPKVSALQEAKRWLRDQRDAQGARPYANPYYWAGFVLMGAAG